MPGSPLTGGRAFTTDREGGRCGSPRAIRLMLAGAGFVTLALLPATGVASCAAPAVATAVATVPTVFVGTVTALGSGGRVATVHVDDIWKGVGISADVQVVGSPDLTAAATSVDRTYASGRRYLFVPVGGSGAAFQDNQCTATQPYTPSLAALRPSDAPGAPAAAATDGGGFAVAYVVLDLAALVPLGLGIAVFRRRAGGPDSPS